MGVGTKVEEIAFHHQQGMYSNACASKGLNFWLKESFGDKEYAEFKLFRTQLAIDRLKLFKAVETELDAMPRVFKGMRNWIVKPNFFNRILYFLFNFIPIDAQITLAEKTLQKRTRKFQVLNAPAA